MEHYSSSFNQYYSMFDNLMWGNCPHRLESYVLCFLRLNFDSMLGSWHQ